MLVGFIFNRSNDGKISRFCGTDCYVKLDGRKTIHNSINDILSYEERLSNIRKATGLYAIVYGIDFKDCLNKVDKGLWCACNIDINDLIN